MALPPDFLERLVASSTTYCKFGSWLKSQKPADVEVVLQALRAKVSTSGLHRYLKDLVQDFDVSRDVLSSHRNGSCACPKQ